MEKFCKERFYCASGDTLVPVYAPKVKADGSIEVVASGYEDLNAFIQSFKESTDIAFILAKLANGDTSVLHQKQGMYGDFTKMPQTFAEVLQFQIDAGRAFDRLPVDIKQKFDNDVNKFCATAGEQAWFEKMDSMLTPEEKELIKPVENVVEKVGESE